MVIGAETQCRRSRVAGPFSPTAPDHTDTGTSLRRSEAHAGQQEVWGHLFGTISTREKFVDKRLELAQHEWARLEINDSLECRNCHSAESMDLIKQSTRAVVAHQLPVHRSEDLHRLPQRIAHQLPDMRSVPGWQ